MKELDTPEKSAKTPSKASSDEDTVLVESGGPAASSTGSIGKKRGKKWSSFVLGNGWHIQMVHEAFWERGIAFVRLWGPRREHIGLDFSRFFANLNQTSIELSLHVSLVLVNKEMMCRIKTQRFCIWTIKRPVMGGFWVVAVVVAAKCPASAGNVSKLCSHRLWGLWTQDWKASICLAQSGQGPWPHDTSVVPLFQASLETKLQSFIIFDG